MNNQIKQTKTNAERQADYRLKNMYRINTIVNSSAHKKLDILSKSYGVTKRKIIEQLLEDEADKLFSTMTEKEVDVFYGL